MSSAALSPALSDFPRHEASQPSDRDTRLRWVAVFTALAFHAAVVLAISPLFHRSPFVDAAPLIVQLLDAPAETEAPGPEAPAPEVREERKPVATPPVRPALALSRTIPEPRPIATEEPPPPTVAVAQPPTPVPPPVAAPETPTVTSSPPAASTAITTPVAATASATAPAGDSAITVSKPAATAAAPVIGAGSAPKEAVTPPRFDADYLANPAPVFPRDAERDGEEGKVILLVKVGVDGAPLAVDIKTSSGWPRLDQAALAAVRRWRFAPAKLGDKAVIASVLVPLTFSLEN